MRFKFHLIIVLTVIATLSVVITKAQDNNVGINEKGNPADKSAILDVSSDTKGVLIPRTDTIQVNAYLASKKIVKKAGLLIYQNNASKFYYFDGKSWKPIGGGGGGTLNDAYNSGGAGKGKSIDANSGAVFVRGSSSPDTCTAIIGIGGKVLSGNYVGTGLYGQGYYGVLGNSSEQNLGFGVVGVGGMNSDAQGNAGTGLYGLGYHGVYGYGITGVLGDGDHSGVSGSAYLPQNSKDTVVGVLGTGLGANGNQIFGVIGQTSTDGATVDQGGVGIYSRNNIGAAGGIYAGLNMMTGQYFAAVEGKQFRIDHPFDPANKYLVHFSIESPEVLNVYRGNEVLNDKGEALVTLPYYFTEINTNFSYQLTPVGASAPGLFIKNEIKGNTFSIAGGKPGMKVSWAVYAERNDLVYRKNPDLRNNEPLKSEKDKGKYLRPELFGQAADKSIFYVNDKLFKIPGKSGSNSIILKNTKQK